MDESTLKQFIFIGSLFYRASQKNCMLHTQFLSTMQNTEKCRTPCYALFSQSIQNTAELMELNGPDFT